MRLVALPLLIYITLDFLDPAIPGVFFFDSDQLFVDGVVQVATDSNGERAPDRHSAAFDSSSDAIQVSRPPRIALSPAPLVTRPRSHSARAHAASPPRPASEDH